MQFIHSLKKTPKRKNRSFLLVSNTFTYEDNVLAVKFKRTTFLLLLYLTAIAQRSPTKTLLKAAKHTKKTDLPRTVARVLR